MNEQEQINAGVAVAAIKLMLRAGAIGHEAVSAMADEYDLLAGRAWHQHEASVHRGVAHQLRICLLTADPPPAIDPAVQFEADFRRRQMRERTARLGASSNAPSDTAPAEDR